MTSAANCTCTPKPNRLETVREIAVILGIIGGGIWAFYRYEREESSEARIRYENLLHQSRSFGLQVAIEAATDARTCMITGNFIVRNQGTVSAMLRLNAGPPIAVSTVLAQPDGRMVSARSVRRYWLDDPDRFPPAPLMVVPGREFRLGFAVPANAGEYNLVQFRPPVHLGRANIPDQPRRWSARAIVRGCRK